jgi:coenzyme F420-dependent glucose-6-phosphate dehydrogenase
VTSYGYALSSEEHRPSDLVDNAAAAEAAGFEFALISDHYHPWVDAQGHSPFVWTVLGGIARATSTIEVGTGVTCPMIRIHPAIIAQAAATTADMFSGRFFLGVGTGENLNEHILGEHWPPYADRREMLIESIEIMRGLWQGDLFSHRGDHYRVENARIYTLPDEPLRIMVAASGPESATLAGNHGDGLVVTSPQRDVVDAYRSASGAGPIYGQVTVCWATNESDARRTVHKVWPNAGLTGDLSQELPLPMHFEQAAENVTAEALAEQIPVGPDPARYLGAIREMADAGATHVYVHQVGLDQAGFFDFWQREVAPELAGAAAR